MRSTQLPSAILAATLELTQADVRGYDIGESIHRFANRGVNVFVVFAVGYLGGESYYPSEVAPAHPQLGTRDFLREGCEAAAEVGAACIAYVNSLFGGPDAWQAHPDWVQRRPDGSATTMGKARAMCPLSPYGQRILAAVEEIGGRYPVQGLYLDEPSFQSWCCCPFCAARFAQDAGMPLPLEAKDDDPAWPVFVRWRYEQIARFTEQARQAFTRDRPGAAFWCQHAFPMTSTAVPQMRKLFGGMLPQRVPASAEGWSRTLFYGQRIERQQGSLDVLSAELWRRFADRPVWWVGLATSYLRSIAAGRPVMAFLEYPDFPWSLRPVPDDELAYVVADVLANGGNAWFPLYAPGEADESGWDTISAVHRALARPDLQGASPAADLALGYSPASADLRSLPDAESGYFDGVLGTARLLREAHVPFRVLALDSLTGAALEGIRTVVIPGAAALAQSTADLLTRFVSAGGRLLLLGGAGSHNVDGTRHPVGVLDKVTGAFAGDTTVPLGIAYLHWHDDASSGHQPALYPVRGTAPEVVLAGAEILGSVRAGYQLFEAPPTDVRAMPVVTRARAGDGVVVCCWLDIGGLARQFPAAGADDLFGRLLQAAGHRSAVQADAPPTVACYPWRSNSGWIVYLLNETGIEDRGRAIPVGPVTVRVPRSTGAAVAAVAVTSHDTAGGAVATARDRLETPVADHWSIHLNQVRTWAVLEITEESS